MADPTDPFPALLQPLLDELAQHPPARLPSRIHAVAGTWLLVAGIYGAHDFMVRYNIDMPGLVISLARHPHDAAVALATPVIWCVLAVLGCLLVVDGVPNERAPHAVSGVFSLCCAIGGCTYALVAGAYIEDDPIASSYLRGFYLATLAASVMEFFLFTRCGWDLPRHFRPGQGRVARTRRSATESRARTRLARAARRGRGGFAQPAASGMF